MEPIRLHDLIIEENLGKLSKIMWLCHSPRNIVEEVPIQTNLKVKKYNFFHSFLCL